MANSLRLVTPPPALFQVLQYCTGTWLARLAGWAGGSNRHPVPIYISSFSTLGFPVIYSITNFYSRGKTR